MSRPTTGQRQPTTAANRRPLGRTLRRYLPPQHGAWAMLAVPYLAGILTVEFRWLDLVVLIALLFGYPLSYYGLQAVKTRRPRRVQRQLLLYGPPAAAATAISVAACPRLLWYAPVYGALLVVHGSYARAGRDRALGNDLTTVVLASLTVPVLATVAGESAARVVVALIAVVAYLTGTVLHVKALIRERDNPTYRRASIAYHVVAFAVTLWLSVPIGAAFGVLLARSAILAQRRLPPKQVGMLELLLAALVVVAIRYSAAGGATIGW